MRSCPQCGFDPTTGDVYIFVGKSRRIMKLLHWERGGYMMYSSVWSRVVPISTSFCARASGSGQCSGTNWYAGMLMEGIPPKTTRRVSINTTIPYKNKINHFASCRTIVVITASGWYCSQWCGRSWIRSLSEALSKYSIEAITELQYSLGLMSWLRQVANSD